MKPLKSNFFAMVTNEMLHYIVGSIKKFNILLHCLVLKGKKIESIRLRLSHKDWIVERSYCTFPFTFYVNGSIMCHRDK